MRYVRAPLRVRAVAEFDAPGLFALAAAVGWASGLRLYATVFLLGVASRFGLMELPAGLAMLEHPAVLGVSGLLLASEWLIDKIPGLDSLWDAFHALLRIPAGAALAAAILGADGAAMATVGALLGGSLAASSQLAKTSARAAINTLPEPVSNIAASVTEDGLTLGVLWLAVTKPAVLAAVLALLVLVSGVIVWLLLRFLRAAFSRLRPRAG